MKRIILLVLSIWVMAGVAFPQYQTSVTLRGLNANPTLKEKIENNLATLIDAINTAQIKGQTPKWENLNIEKKAENSISSLWETSPFRCEEPDIVEKVNRVYGGNEYEVRNLPFYFVNLEEDDRAHDVAVTFNTKGQITSFHISVSQNMYQSMVSNFKDDVTEFRRRQMILDYVEQFRTAYETKDLAFMQQIFSEDALIITGRVISQKPTADNGFQKTKTEYLVQSKKQYLERLRPRFAKNQPAIRVKFDSIRIMQHPVESDWYGVNLVQDYTRAAYHDDGYLFLLWDFTDEEKPQIHVRTWQDRRDTKREDIIDIESPMVEIESSNTN